MTQPTHQPASKGPPKSTLAAIVGVIAAGGLFVSIPQDESGGKEYLKAYRDIVGVWTICDGDTYNVGPQTIETREGCRKRLETQLIAHAEPVMNCSPHLKEPGRDYQRWAAISLGYNIGTGGYCRSTVDRRFDSGDYLGGCNAILMWNKAGGKVVRGLDLRRKREWQICTTGLLPGHTPQNLEYRVKSVR